MRRTNASSPALSSPCYWGHDGREPPPKFLCRECSAKFDGQKMRGRFRAAGMTDHEQLVRLAADLDPDAAERGKGFALNIGHPKDEERYTESIDEWVSWQTEKGSDS